MNHRPGVSVPQHKITKPFRAIYSSVKVAVPRNGRVRNNVTLITEETGSNLIELWHIRADRTWITKELVEEMLLVDCVWNVTAHAQKPDFVFLWNGRVHLNRQGLQFNRLLADEVCASAVVMLDTPCSQVVWRVLATHSIRRFPFQFPSRASPCAIAFQLDSKYSEEEQHTLVKFTLNPNALPALCMPLCLDRNPSRKQMCSCKGYHNKYC